MKPPRNKKQIFKVGDRVTTMARTTDGHIWGTIVKITDLRRPHLNITGSKRFIARILWDTGKEEIESCSRLFKHGEAPIQGFGRILLDPKQNN
jgi:hypothetical protein